MRRIIAGLGVALVCLVGCRDEVKIERVPENKPLTLEYSSLTDAYAGISDIGGALASLVDRLSPKIFKKTSSEREKHISDIFDIPLGDYFDSNQSEIDYRKISDIFPGDLR